VDAVAASSWELAGKTKRREKPSRAKSLANPGMLVETVGWISRHKSSRPPVEGGVFFLTSLFIELIDCSSVGVDRMQCNFDPMRKQVEVWQRSQAGRISEKPVLAVVLVEGVVSVERPRSHANAILPVLT
jgi:hypothetical protein